jgi:large-conductance mechanosensitive channel
MKVEKTREEIRKYRLAIVKQMLQLATAGFGLVAALAWNELIKAFIEDFIKPRVGVGSGIISLALYALIVTALAVFVTLQLSKLAEKMEKEE